MYPAPFRYHRPQNLDAAVQLLARLGEDAKPLAGGQTLIPMLKMRMGDVTDLVDIGRLPDLADIQLDGEQARIGALATHARIAVSKVAERLPSVRDCAGGIADAQVRARGTIGGSVSTGDPSTDWAPLLHTFATVVEIQGASGKRELAIEDFIIDAYTTALQTFVAVIRECYNPFGYSYESLLQSAIDSMAAGMGLASRAAQELYEFKYIKSHH